MRRLILLLINLTLVTGCAEAIKSDVRNTVQETFTATAVSMLSQAQWQSLAANLKGKIGPETMIEIEGYMKHSAGAKIYIHGAELEVGLQGQGTGGNPNERELVSQIRAIAQRYALQADRVSDARIDRNKMMTAEILALIKAYADVEKAPTTQPATQPATQPGLRSGAS